MFIPLIDRYLLSEVAKALIAVLIVLVLVVHSHGFISLLDDVAEGKFNVDVLFQMFGLQIVRYLPRLIPPAFFFAILYALGRMYQDSEMIALQSCGVGTRRIYRAFVFSAVPLALISGWLTLFTSPWAATQIEIVKEQQKGQAAELAGISAGQFNEYHRGNLVFYVETLDKTRHMSNLFIQRRTDDGVELVTASEGHHMRDPETGDRYIVLSKGHRNTGVPGQADYSVGTFENYSLRIGSSTSKPINLKRAALPTAALWASNDPADKAELQRRFSFPLAVIVFALVSIPLSRSLPRQGIYGRLFFAFIVYFVFLNLQGLSQKWMEDGLTPEWLGMWWVHGLMVILTVVLLYLDSSRFKNWRRPLRRSARASRKYAA